MPNCLYAILLTAIFAGAGVAAPFVPRSDAEVLERLPFRPNDPVAREISKLRKQLVAEPNNVNLALQLARSYFTQAGAQSDPRFVGYAQAALKPWWDLPQPPAGVLVMRATLRQYVHDFAGAIVDIDSALKIKPSDIDALSLRADINLVQGNYAASRKDCERMAPLVTVLSDVGCVTFIDGMTGRARQSHDALEKELARTKSVSPDQHLWILTRLAEMAWRLNEPKLAERHFRRALALNVTDGFLLAAYADFLLDHGRHQEVFTLLKDWERADPLLLRLTLAEQALERRHFREHQAALAARYAAAGCAAISCTSRRSHASACSVMQPARGGAEPGAEQLAPAARTARRAHRCWKRRSRCAGPPPRSRCSTGWRRPASKTGTCAGLAARLAGDAAKK